ncbi:unnamed protein product [Candidula unifasciata]|uniref:BZIP domain-containing protein n=1 Tax=Candidula unifasciata TaxID=100452 RepID=A0A8S3YSR1_9EUPU|nr:unnamed protein product [Candidula unifasciata]
MGSVKKKKKATKEGVTDLGNDKIPITKRSMSIGETSSGPSSRTTGKRPGKRPGRKASRVDESAKLERSRQSARECRARKKLRYQYLEELVQHREKAVFALRDELETYKQWCTQLDTEQRVPDSLLKMIASERISQERKQREQANRLMILQRQRKEEISQFSSSSSSPDSSPSPRHEQSQQTSHPQLGGEPSITSQVSLHQTPSSSQQKEHPVGTDSSFHHHSTQHQTSSQQQRNLHIGLEPSVISQSTSHQMSSSSQQHKHQIGTGQSYNPQSSLLQMPSSSSQTSHHQTGVEPLFQIQTSSEQDNLQTVTEPSFDPRGIQPQTSSSSEQKRHQIVGQSCTSQAAVHQKPSTSSQESNRQIGVEPLFQPYVAQDRSSSSSEIGHPPTVSPHHFHRHHQGQRAQTMQHKTSLRRQMAFDKSHPDDTLSNVSSHTETIIPKRTPNIQSHAQSFESKTSIFPQQQRVQQLLQQHHMQHARTESSLSAPLHYNIPQHISQRSLHPQKTSVESEPPLKYEHPSDVPGTNPSASIETRRARSLSNPASMVNFPRSSTYASSSRSLPGSSRTVQTPLPTPWPSDRGSGQGLGLFSGSSIGCKISPLTLSIPASAAVEESSSSDENVNERQLFHSSLLPFKRTSADPAVTDNTQWIATSRSSTIHSGSTSFNTDPNITLSNLTTIHCLSTTRTCNTPSPSPVGLGPSGLPSPSSVSKYMGISGSTPSSSASTSPAPLSSLSSLFESSAPSPVMSSSTFSTQLDPADLHLSEHASSIPDSFHCSAMSLSASIDEPIPELYSFLADLEEGGMSSLSSRHGASSSHSTPLALTPRQHDQPSTPDPAYLNVPKIIDEYLDSDKEDS